jgi:signal transduction histidine kinase
MYDETQVLLRLVEDLHTLSLADSGELVLRREPLDTGRLLSRAVQTYRDAAAQAGVILSVELSAPVAPIFADPDQLVRVLGNLVSNALRHTPLGGTITLGAHDEAAAVILTVTDSGEGIAPEHLPNVFERFYRADSSRHTASGGSGLGLAIVRSIVEAHGGQVVVTSKLGEGTCFTITMPTIAA